MGWLACALLGCAMAARGDVGVVIADPTQVGGSVWTHAGHASVYLSNVCAETPVKLRLCRSGEQGSIVTAYPGLHENRHYEWNALPLQFYLYGTMGDEQQPLYASAALKRAQEGREAAQGWLQPVCAGACPQIEHAYWRDLVNATAARDVYIFAVRTTRQQDEAFVERMNAAANRNRYGYMTYNCADFARDLINQYYPRSVHRDVLNDLGMTSPKSAARSLTRYAKRHPELSLHAMHFIQQPGTVARAGTAQVGTEVAFHQPKYLLPAAAIGDHEVAGSFLVAYYLTGRFGLQKTYERHAAALDDAGDATAGGVVGTREQWSAYRERFRGVVADAVRDGTLRNAKEVRKIFAETDRETIPVLDPDGGAWLVWRAGTPEERRVGVDWSTVQAAGSDRRLARRLLLARIDAELRGKAKTRPPTAEFAREWALLGKLQSAEEQAEIPHTTASAPTPPAER